MTDTAMNDSINAQVAALPGLPIKDLWALWDAHFPRRPAHTNRHYVESRLAYRLQEQAYGPLPVGRAPLSGGARRAVLQDPADRTRHGMPSDAWHDAGARMGRARVPGHRHGGGPLRAERRALQEPVGGGAPHHRHAVVGTEVLWGATREVAQVIVI